MVPDRPLNFSCRSILWNPLRLYCIWAHIRPFEAVNGQYWVFISAILLFLRALFICWFAFLHANQVPWIFFFVWSWVLGSPFDEHWMQFVIGGNLGFILLFRFFVVSETLSLSVVLYTRSRVLAYLPAVSPPERTNLNLLCWRFTLRNSYLLFFLL